MSITRRNLCSCLPALLAAHAMPGADDDAGKPAVPSTIFHLNQARVLGDATDHYIPVLDGSIHTGLDIKLHETELAPHAMADPPHKHRGEELFMVREGTLHLEVDGKFYDLAPGDVGYVASNVEHGTGNLSGEWVRYFALLLGSPKP
jgi:quercetin dioxygenase-like cupin family protein